jgi:hypothetical protein
MSDSPESTPTEPARLGRRTYVVDRSFQLKYTLLLALTGAAISAVFGVLMYAAHLEARRTLEAYRDVVPSMWIKQALSQGETTMLWLVAGVTVMMAIALALFGIFLTHRVAGPVFVMSSYMSVLAKGRFPKMRPLRKNDELKDFFDRFQGAVEMMKKREADEAAQLKDAVDKLSPLAQAADARAAVEAIRSIQERKAFALDPGPATAP